MAATAEAAIGCVAGYEDELSTVMGLWVTGVGWGGEDLLGSFLFVDRIVFQSEDHRI